MKKKAMIGIGLLVVLVLAVSLAAGCKSAKKDTTQKAETVKPADNYVVQLGYYNCDHMVGACVAKDAGIFDEMGLKVNVTGNGKVPQAMAAGQMDVGYIGTDGMMFAHMKGSPIFMAANNHIGGSYYLVASNNIKDAKDLVGKKLALGTDAEKNDPWWVAFSKKLGIPADSKKYENFDMDLKNKFFALRAGQLDGFTTCDPYGSWAEYENLGHIVAGGKQTEGDIWGLCCCYSMREGFATEHPELASKMVLAHTKAIEYIYLHPVHSAKIFAKYYDVPEEVALMTIYKKTGGEGRTLTWKIDKKEMQKFFDDVKEVPNYTNVEPMDKWINTSILDNCGANDFDTFIKTKVDSVFPTGMNYEDWKKKAYEVDPV